MKQFDNISEQFKKVADRLDSLEKGQDELRKRQDELTVGVEILARERGDVKVQKAMELAKELHDNFKERHRSACCRVLTKGMELGSPEHMAQCVFFTGEVAEETVRIIVEF